MFSGSISLSAVLGERPDARAAPAPAAADAAGRSDKPASGPASGVDETEPVKAGDLARHANETAYERKRILDWADAIRAADGSEAFLITRPDPDGRRPSYPSAAEAYRDIAEVIGAL